MQSRHRPSLFSWMWNFCTPGSILSIGPTWLPKLPTMTLNLKGPN